MLYLLFPYLLAALLAVEGLPVDEPALRFTTRINGTDFAGLSKSVLNQTKLYSVERQIASTWHASFAPLGKAEETSFADYFADMDPLARLAQPVFDAVTNTTGPQVLSLQMIFDTVDSLPKDWRMNETQVTQALFNRSFVPFSESSAQDVFQRNIVDAVGISIMNRYGDAQQAALTKESLKTYLLTEWHRPDRRLDPEACYANYTRAYTLTTMRKPLLLNLVDKIFTQKAVMRENSESRLASLALCYLGQSEAWLAMALTLPRLVITPPQGRIPRSIEDVKIRIKAMPANRLRSFFFLSLGPFIPFDVLTMMLSLANNPYPHVTFVAHIADVFGNFQILNGVTRILQIDVYSNGSIYHPPYLSFIRPSEAGEPFWYVKKWLSWQPLAVGQIVPKDNDEFTFRREQGSPKESNQLRYFGTTYAYCRSACQLRDYCSAFAMDVSAQDGTRCTLQLGTLSTPTNTTVEDGYTGIVATRRFTP